jgi:two-component system NtrC family sensor kinase
MRNSDYTDLDGPESGDEEFLRERFSSLGLIISGVSHEIRNPLAYIQSNLKILSRYNKTFSEYIALCQQQSQAIKSGDLQKAKELIQLIEDHQAKNDLDYLLSDSKALIEESVSGTERIQEITESINAFFKAQKMEVREVNINEQLDVTLKVMAHKLRERCAIERHYGDIPLVECSPGLINQALMNLLINALQAIELKGKITLETTQHDSFVEIRISDTGHGIEQKDLNKIFSLFYTTKREKGGQGVGLALTKKIIEQHNGTIELRSKLGEGTTFFVRLPIKQ